MPLQDQQPRARRGRRLSLTATLAGLLAVGPAVAGFATATAAPAAAASASQHHVVGPLATPRIGNNSLPSGSSAAHSHLLGAAPRTAASVKTFTVTTTMDVPAASPGSGTCATSSTPPTCSLRAAVQEADAEGVPVTIVVPAGTYLLRMGSLVLTDPAGITISGAGAASTVIDAATQAPPDRAFSESAGANNAPVLATITGVTVENGTAPGTALHDPGNGGAIDVPDPGDSLVLSQDVFSGNSADSSGGMSGGAIFASGGVWVDHTTFAGNAAQYGGAIYQADNGLSLLDDSFSGNMATGGSTIGSNGTANAGGGAVDAEADVAATGTAFDGNQALVTASGSSGGGSGTPTGFNDAIGGAMLIEAASQLTGDTFTDNYAGPGSPGGIGAASGLSYVEGFGGAIEGGIGFAGGDQLTMTGNSVSSLGSGTTSAGGAVAIGYPSYNQSLVPDTPNATFNGLTASGNSATTDVGSAFGGALGVVPAFGGIGPALRATPHINCLPFCGGGGGGVIDVNGSSFTANTAVSTGGSGEAAGGAVSDAVTGAFNIDRSTLAGNSVTQPTGASNPLGGGAVFDAYTSGGKITRSTLSGNSVNNGEGGALLVEDNTEVLAEDTITGNHAGDTTGGTGNFTGGGGGIASSGQLSITDTRIAGNAADQLGGGIGEVPLSPSIVTTELSNSTITGNTAVDGGGIFSYADLTMTSSALTDNVATGTGTSGGGGLDIGRTGNLTDDTIAGNVAAYAAGISDHGQLTLKDSTVAGNTTPAPGATEQDCGSGANQVGSAGGNVAGDTSCNLVTATDRQGAADQGYWEVAADGGIFTFNTPFLGSEGGKALNQPVVGMARTPGNGGYWEVAADGGIFTFGNAGFFGSMGGTPLAKPVVGMAATPDGQGYWEVAADGGVFAFGDAPFFGSMGGTPLAAPVVAMAATPDGEGYWLVAADGGVFTFGDAGFFGSEGGKALNKPVVGIMPATDGNGYSLVAADGGVFTFGTAGFFGSEGGKTLNQPVVAMLESPDMVGYWQVAADGGIFTFGNAAFQGSMGGQPLNAPVVGGAAT